MTPRPPEDSPAVPKVVPVFFLSDSTGISAETMGNALLIQFPDLRFERTLIPFISTVEQAREVVAQLDEAMEGPVAPLVFTTAAVDEVREELLSTRAPIIDFFGHAHEAGSRSSSAPAGCGRPAGCTASATSGGTTTGWRPSSSPSSTTTG